MSDRFSSGCESEAGIRPPDKSREGWSWRCVIDPARAQEVRELYTAVGFEVKLQQAAPDQFPARCTGCAVNCETKILVYTRKPGEQHE